MPARRGWIVGMVLNEMNADGSRRFNGGIFNCRRQRASPDTVPSNRFEALAPVLLTPTLPT